MKNKKTLIRPLYGEQTPEDEKLRLAGVESMEMLLKKLPNGKKD